MSYSTTFIIRDEHNTRRSMKDKFWIRADQNYMEDRKTIFIYKLHIHKLYQVIMYINLGKVFHLIFKLHKALDDSKHWRIRAFVTLDKWC